MMRFAGGPMMAQHWIGSCDFQGIWTSFAKEPYIFVIFLGGEVRADASPSGSAHDAHLSSGMRGHMFGFHAFIFCAYTLQRLCRDCTLVQALLGLRSS